jgi:hypothetical protein
MTDYDFRSLSPIDFESLVRDLLNAELGVLFSSFGVGPDGGVDLRGVLGGSTIVGQCKHYPGASKAELLRAARIEAGRTKLPAMDSYVFIVSTAISPGVDEELLLALDPLPVNAESVWHAGKLNAALVRHKRVEQAHVKLWLSSAAVLDQIVAASQWQRSEQLLQTVAGRVRLHVHTAAYYEAFRLLEKEHVVMLSGAPGVGKSTMAEMLLLTLWSDGWTVVNIASDVDEAWRQLRANGEKVVFYYDDFLGQTSTSELQKNEGAGIADLIERVRRHGSSQLLILTTREQVLNYAVHGEDDRLRRLGHERSKFQIELSKVSRLDRAKMLFNHLYFGFSESSDLKAELSTDERFIEVIDHVGFNPRVLEAVALKQHHQSVDDFYATLFDALDHPNSIWAGSFAQLSKTAVSILFQLSMSPQTSVPIEEVRRSVSVDDPREWIDALKVMEGTWIRLSPDRGTAVDVQLFDPSRRDYLLDLLDQPSHFDAAMKRISTIEQLNYLSRLAGLIPNAAEMRKRGSSNSLLNNARRRMSDFDGTAAALVRAQLEGAATPESANSSSGAEWNSSRARPRTATRRKIIETKVTALTELARFCFGTDFSSPQSLLLLEESVSDTEEDFAAYNMARPLFKLAAELAFAPEAPDWAIENAIEIAGKAFEVVSDTEDLRYFGGLPQWFRDGPFLARGTELLTEALENEVRGIRQQNDKDTMESWLDEVESLAGEHYVYLDVDDLRQEIEEMEGSSRSPDRVSVPARPGAVEGLVEDDELKTLFRQLRQ